MLVSDVLDDVRKTYLNDTSGTIYTDNVLLPFIQSAYSELQTEFLLNGLQSLSEISAVIDVTAGTTSLSVPSDFVSPIKLQERADGGTADDWVDMTELRHDYEQTDSTTLNYWTFREDGIYVGPATTNRDVKLYYYKSLTVSSINSTIPIIGADEFLAARTAEAAARYIGMNPVLADSMGKEASESLDKLVRRNIKTMQGIGTSRKPYQYRVKIQGVI